jgi:uncharacterized protein (TIGR02217 family)
VSAADQAIGTGDGARIRFALVKTYGEGDDAYRRLIARPLVDTLRVAVDGVEKAMPADWSFDSATGEVVFEAGSVPDTGQVVTAGYEFDVPVRFDTERIAVSLTAFKAGQIPSILLIEVRQ